MKNLMLDGDMLLGKTELYRLTGKNAYRQFVFSTVDSAIDDEKILTKPLNGKESRILFFMYEETGLEKYKRAIDMQLECMNLNEIGAQPFYTEYETRFKNKEHYSEITECFKRHENFTTEDVAALADTIGSMSEEIYEHYRALQKILKREITRLLKDEEKMQEDEKAALGYAILKSCNTGTLLKEKYEMTGTLIWKSLAGGVGTPGSDEYIDAGMQLRSYAQYLLLNKQEVSRHEE